MNLRKKKQWIDGGDPAAFDFDALARIWGEPRSVLSGLREIQWHHIEGRSGKDPEKRRIHSSLFNAIPLTDAEHDWGAINQPELKEYFHRKAYTKVIGAAAIGIYELTEEDRQYRLKFPD